MKNLSGCHTYGNTSPNTRTIYSRVKADKSKYSAMELIRVRKGDFTRNKEFVSHLRKVYWIIQTIAKSNCRVNTRFFPFDTHHCQLIFAPERAPNVVLKTLVPKVVVSFYTQKNSDWTLVKSGQKVYPTEIGVKGVTRFSLYFKYLVRTTLT